MRKIFRRWQQPWTAWGLAGLALLVIASAGAGAGAAWAQAGAEESVRLTSAGRGVKLGVALTPAQTQWLREHQTLTVGVVPNDIVPFDLLGFDSQYEGISADYLDMIARTLGISLRFRTFASKADALAALERGDVSIVPTMLRVDPLGDYALSSPYFSTEFVEVVAENHMIDSSAAVKVGALLDNMIVPAVRDAFPRAQVTTYASALEALQAVADREIEVLVADSASASFLIDQYRMSTLQAYSFGEKGMQSQHFAVRAGDATLLKLINTTLDAIPARTVRSIRVRWSPGLESGAFTERVSLSPEERRWIAANPVVRFAVSEDRVPFMFRDPSGKLSGVAVELLERIGRETGLRFEPGGPFNGRMDGADVFPLLLRGSATSETMLLSSPYYRGIWTFVSRAGQPRITRLADLHGKRLAFRAPNSLVQRLKARVPGLVLVPTPSVIAGYEEVKAGHADLTLGTVNTANYMVAERYSGVLKLAGSLGDAPVAMTMGVRPDAPLLQSIIDKALEAIPPDGSREMRANVAYFIGPMTDWKRYIRGLYALVALLAACGILVLLWTRSLQKEVRRRVEAEAEAREQLVFQRAMLEGIPHAICVRDSEGRLLNCNSAYERLFAARRDDLVGTTLMDVSRAPSLAQSRAVHLDYLRLLAEGGSLSDDMDLVIDGETKRVWYWAAAIASENGGPSKALVAGALDMTERHQLVQLIEAARAKAEAANRAKSNFLATMSHEIRTPMNAVLGMLELVVREGRLSAEDRESVDLARNSARSLLGLIDDILDISKIEAGGLEVLPRPAQLRPIIRDVAQVFAGLAHRRGLTVAIEIDPRVAKWHAVDPMRFRQIVNNLVSNAIKYTDTGGVTVRLRHEALEEGVETVNLEVADTGIGISKEEIKNLFRPFFQAESAGPRTIGGTGLGLPIVQRLCHTMGSEIAVRSEPGRGTVVTIDFHLPVAEAPDLEAHAAPETISRSLLLARDRYNVLVVDDHPANRALLQRQLAHLGIRSVAAENGKIALELWRNSRFDLVITDLSMPVMDGYEFTVALREHERLAGWPHCPVLGCTAHVQEHDRRRALDVGVDECLMKPVGVDTLTEALGRHLVGLSTGPAAEETAAAGPVQGGQPFDLAILHSFSGGDAKVESSFLDALLRTNLSDQAELAEQVRDGNRSAIASGAHRIKGAARIVKAERVVHDCDMLENAAQGGVIEDIRAAFATLEQSMAEFNAALEAQLRVYDLQPTSS